MYGYQLISSLHFVYMSFHYVVMDLLNIWTFTHVVFPFLLHAFILFATHTFCKWKCQYAMLSIEYNTKISFPSLQKYNIYLWFSLANRCNMFLLSKHIFSHLKYPTLIFMQTIFNTFPLQNSLTPFPYDYFYGEIHNTKKKLAKNNK